LLIVGLKTRNLADKVCRLSLLSRVRLLTLKDLSVSRPDKFLLLLSIVFPSLVEYACRVLSAKNTVKLLGEVITGVGAVGGVFAFFGTADACK
jgi:hypothetical protein